MITNALAYLHPLQTASKLFKKGVLLASLSSPEAEFVGVLVYIPATIVQLSVKGMKQLKVLDFYGIHFPSLPSSLQCLTNLLTLCLNGCKLGDIDDSSEAVGFESFFRTKSPPDVISSLDLTKLINFCFEEKPVLSKPVSTIVGPSTPLLNQPYIYVVYNVLRGSHVTGDQGWPTSAFLGRQPLVTIEIIPTRFGTEFASTNSGKLLSTGTCI
ncbi:hypothetical protein CK203_048851 [Vitis vinifera]|uniref:Uncharacterized protein n=1 Tax=Vitis vinifera TaxID=29760 RepID=A0A438FKU3_VITVI|nr:hypothetical protein CK203_048851 [Vitis vinifera]